MQELNQNNVDVKENLIIEKNPELLEVLLKDYSTKRNIIWATDDYSELGAGYSTSDEITVEAITGTNGNIIMPRSVKSKETQGNRTRNMAEVFTPTWICNKMNNLVDDAWFGRENIFNVEEKTVWNTCIEKIVFPNKNKTGAGSWMDYIAAKRLEITCGEAPYLVSRYDTVTGDTIPLENRIGILDRKLRVINEKVRNFKDVDRAKKRWLQLAKLAVQNTYGFEWQGDNVLLARENLLYTVVDYFQDKFSEEMSKEWLLELGTIIAWNIWQMDGIKCVVPDSCHDYKKPRKTVEPSLFDSKASSATILKRSMSFCDVNEDELQKCQGCLKENVELHNGIYCKIKNWSNGKIYKFKDLLSKQESELVMSKDFKFDVVIGNPPYQDSTSVNNRSGAIYPYFYDSAELLSDKYMLISPARFLFNTGLTSKEWNKKMLSDCHLKVMHYTSDSSQIFPNTDIKGGIVILFRDKNSDYGAIEEFIPNNELRKIASRFEKNESVNLSSIIYGGRSALKFNDTFLEAYPDTKEILLKEIQKKHPSATKLSPNEEYELKSSTFKTLPHIFCENNPVDEENYYKILGLLDSKREYRWIKREYMTPRYEDNNIDNYKVLVPESNGSGAFGEVLSTPIVSIPGMSSTPTFISVGNFDNITEAINLLKYIKTKFVRSLLGVLKKTQHNGANVWSYIPMQNFTAQSDIDWDLTVAEIDQQLYKKYNLTAEETAFIEQNVKEMD